MRGNGLSWWARRVERVVFHGHGKWASGVPRAHRVLVQVRPGDACGEADDDIGDPFLRSACHARGTAQLRKAVAVNAFGVAIF